MAEKQASYYNEYFREKDSSSYNYKDIHYFVNWVQVEFTLRDFKDKRILEIGCGPGQLGNYLQDEGYPHYRGFDFSEQAISIARQNASWKYEVGNAFDKSMYEEPYDVTVCLEVLEHLDDDLGAIDMIKEGTYCIISVPNFDDPGHVRWFRSEYQVRKRFFKKIDIDRINFINNIYIFSGYKNEFSPNFFQNILKSREEVSLGTLWNRFRFRLKHRFKIKG